MWQPTKHNSDLKLEINVGVKSTKSEASKQEVMHDIKRFMREHFMEFDGFIMGRVETERDTALAVAA